MNKDLANKIPNFNEDRFVFDTNNVVLTENTITTSSIIITKKWHCYNDCHRVEALDISANKDFYFLLGTKILEYLFHKKNSIISIKNSNSTLHYIKIGDQSSYPNHFGLQQNNLAYNYWPAAIIHRYPFQNAKVMPDFHLVHFDENKSCITETDWKTRDCLQISGNDDVMASIAELFLNIAHPQNDLDEICLETAAGYGGVSATSVEVTFWLPNSIGFSANF